MLPFTLPGSGALIRAATGEDVDSIHEYLTGLDPESLARRFKSPSVPTKAVVSHGWADAGLIALVDGRVVAELEARPSPRRPVGRAEIGFSVAQTFRRRGIARSLVATFMMSVARTQLVRHVSCRVDADNVVATTVLTAAGLRAGSRDGARRVSYGRDLGARLILDCTRASRLLVDRPASLASYCDGVYFRLGSPKEPPRTTSISLSALLASARNLAQVIQIEDVATLELAQTHGVRPRRSRVILSSDERVVKRATEVGFETGQIVPRTGWFSRNRPMTLTAQFEVLGAAPSFLLCPPNIRSRRVLTGLEPGLLVYEHHASTSQLRSVLDDLEVVAVLTDRPGSVAALRDK